MPRLNALWRSAPIVRFIAFEIFATGSFAFEYFFNSTSCAFVQAKRFVFNFFFFAIRSSIVSEVMASMRYKMVHIKTCIEHCGAPGTGRMTIRGPYRGE